MKAKKRVFLIDGNAYCYRAFYAIKNLSTSKGQSTNAVYGFVTMLNKLLHQEKPDYLSVCFDLKGPTFRHKKFEDYKAQRKPMPDSLITQMPLIKEMVAAYNIPIFELEGFEADDLLATIAKKLATEGVEVYLVTGDKDALQLVNSHIKVYNPQKDNLIYDQETVKEKFGVGPEKITEIMGLMGDSSDNIPGVPGIGEKTAVELIKQFGSLEEVLKKADTIEPERLRQSLKQFDQQARLSRDLAVLDHQAPIEFELEKMQVQEPDNEKLFSLFQKLEFRGLLKKVASNETITTKVEVISDKKSFQLFIKELDKQNCFSFDFETTSADPMQAKIVGISFCWKEGQAYYLPLKELEKETAVIPALKPIWQRDSDTKIGQNLKYEIIILKNLGIRLCGQLFDTMLASYLLNPSKLNHNLDDITLEYLNHKMTPITDLIGKGKTEISMSEVPLEQISAYAGQDADVPFRLKTILEKKLAAKNLEELFYNIELPLINVLAEMEVTGVALDVKFLDTISIQLKREIDKLTKDIYEVAGGEFNIKSPLQLRRVLFEKLKLPVVRRNKTGPSTDEGVLQRLATQHALPATILKYREMAKLKSTYVDALPKLLNARTKRIHTSFNQTVTATGRLSSSTPNLQNIPIKTELGRQVRKAFVPRNKDYVLLCADYSQIELRLLAHIAQDKNMISTFEEGRDIHTHTASLIFGVKENEVTPEMRSNAKTVNFGIIYGMSPYGLSQDLGIKPEEAKSFIEAYFERYPQVAQCMKDEIEFARENGFVTTIFNRRRYIPEINSGNMNLRQFAERTAINTPIQGSAADLIKVAMIDLHNALSDKFKSRMMLQVHDELVFEVAKEELEKVRKIVKEKMEQAVKLKVPVEVTIKTGRNWLEAN